MSTHCLYLDSTRRDPNTTNYNCTFNFNLPLKGRYKLKNLIYSNFAWNVNPSNYKIYFREDGTNKTASLTYGYYSGSELVTEIKTQMEATSGGYNTFAVVLNAKTQTLSITADFPYQFMFASGESSACHLMGFEPVNTSANVLQVSDSPINIIQPYVYCFEIKYCNTRLESLTDQIYSSFSVPLLQSFGGVEHFESKQGNEIYFDFHDLPKRMTVEVKDIYGNYITNMSNFLMILEKCNNY